MAPFPEDRLSTNELPDKLRMAITEERIMDMYT